MVVLRLSADWDDVGVPAEADGITACKGATVASRVRPMATEVPALPPAMRTLDRQARDLRAWVEGSLSPSGPA